jgi:hypothetical protein
MFPGAGAQIHYNEVGEPASWDYPGPEYDDYDPDDYLPDDEDDEEWEDDGDEPDIHDPAHETGAPPADRYDPHPSHCCQRHGCKYGSRACTVATPENPTGKAQMYPCEQCSDEEDEDRETAELINAAYDLGYAAGREAKHREVHG